VKILWFSNAPWATSGYGVQTRLIGSKISSLGHEIHYASNYGLQGATVALDEKSRVYPSLSADQRDYFLLPYHAKNIDADIVVTLYDVWTMPLSVASSFRWVPLVPIQWDRPPEIVHNILQNAYRVIAYSRFGQDKLKEVGIDALYLPHCFDPKDFRYHDKKEAREKLNFPQDRFIALMVAMNKGFPCRKSFPEVLSAWRQFNERHPDSLLHLHTCPIPVTGGVDIHTIVKSLDFPKNAVSLPDIYDYLSAISADKLSLLYSAADVLLLPSRSEGFGVPLIESAACGTPVITSDFGPMRELCFSGWLVDGQGDWDPYLGAWQFVPFVHSILSCLEQAYQAKVDGKLTLLGNQASIAAREYSVDAVTQNHLVPILEELEESLSGVGSLEMLRDL